MENKRGLSPVIATVLLLLLTISAAAIIAGIVIPFTKTNLSKSTQCSSYQNYLSFEEVFELGGIKYRYNCRAQDSDVNTIQDGYYHGFSIRVKSDDKLYSGIQGIDVVFSSRTGESQKIRVVDGQETENVRLLDGSSILKIPESGVSSYVYFSGENSYEKIEVYPVLKNGDICPMNDNIDIIFCDADGPDAVADDIKGAFATT